MVALGFTLFRNDVLRDVAKTAGQETAYLRLEQTLGSPGFGTPRAVAHLSELTPLEAVLPPAPRLEAPPVVETPSRPSEPAPATHSEGAPSPSPAANAIERQPAARDASLTSLVAAQVGGEAKRPNRRAPAERTPPVRRTSQDRESKGLGIKGSANKFDPLNGKL
jgi:hypothetical protein